MIMLGSFDRLLGRFYKYAGVGFSTFILDLIILYGLLTFTSASEPLAITLGFLVGITTNYLLCYYFVYRGTERNVYLGYFIFFVLALTGLWIITTATLWFTTQLQMNIYLSRILIAGIVGSVNFLLNTFFNFRLV